MAVGEELGFVGLLPIAAVYAVIACAWFRVGRERAEDYGFFLATAVTLFLIVPGLVMVAGGLGVIPLTGVVTPFLSYGGSAMAANFAGLGILAAIRAAARSPAMASRSACRRDISRGALGVAALGILAALLKVQVFQPNEYVVKPHLGLQADGGADTSTTSACST